MTEAEMIAKGKILYEVLRNVMKGAFTLMVPVGAFQIKLNDSPLCTYRMLS